MILDKIRLIKYSRLKEEERFFLETIDGIKPFKSTNYPKSIFWGKDNEVLFEQDYENGWLRINYKLIWSIFSTKYGYSYDDTELYIKDVVNKHTKLGSFTPNKEFYVFIYPVNRPTKLGSLTPISDVLSDIDENLGSLTPISDVLSDIYEI